MIIQISTVQQKYLYTYYPCIRRQATHLSVALTNGKEGLALRRNRGKMSYM